MSLLQSLSSHDHIVVSGCGTRAMFLIGLFEYLTNHPCWDDIFGKLKGSAGVSSGCVIALAILVGADFTAMKDALVELGRQHDSIAPSLSVPLAMESFGLDDGNQLQLTIDTVLHVAGLSTSTTFQSLSRLTGGKDFRVCAVNMHTMTPHFFCRNTTPHMPLRDAIYMSMTIPFIFKPRRWMGELYVDGGMLDNFPTSAFGDNVVPLVLYMSWNTTGSPTSLRTFACAIACSTLHVQLERLLRWGRDHPESVHVLVDGGDGEWVSLNTDPDYMLASSQRGLVQGLMCQRGEVLRLLSTVAILATQAEQAKGRDTANDV